MWDWTNGQTILQEWVNCGTPSDEAWWLEILKPMLAERDEWNGTVHERIGNEWLQK
jgi:hypothetical protein